MKAHVLRLESGFRIGLGGLLLSVLGGCAATSADGTREYQEQQLQAQIHSQKVRLAEQQAALAAMNRQMQDIGRRLEPATGASASAGEPATFGNAVAVSAGPANGLVAAAAPATGAPSAGAPATAAPPAAGPDIVAGDDHFREKVSETLRELLKDPAFAKEFKGGGGAKVGYKKDNDFQSSGFFIEDGDFRLNMEGRLQVRYNYANYLDKNSRNGAVRTTDDSNFDSRSDFSIPRLRFTFAGTAFSPDLKYDFQLNASSNNRAAGDAGGSGVGDIVTIWTAFLDYNILNSNKEIPEFWRQALQIKVGQFHQPFGRWGSTNHWGTVGDGDNETIDRNFIQEVFRYDRAIGVELHGMLGGTREGLPEDRPGTKGFFEYSLAVNNGSNSAGQRYGLDAGATGIPGRGLDKYPALLARGNFDILKGRYEGLDGKDYYWFGRNSGDLEHHETPAWQAGGSFAWQRMRDQNAPSNNPVLGDFYNPPQLVERLPVYNSKGVLTGYTNGNNLPLDQPGSDIIRVGGETAFKWKGFSLTSEVFYQHVNSLFNTNTFGVPQANQNQDNFGWYVQSGYFVIPREWELFGGVGGIHSPSRPVVGNLPVLTGHETNDQFTAAQKAAAAAHVAGTDGSANGDSYQFSFGTNWFPFQNRKLKVTLQGNYLVNPPLNSATQGIVQRGGENNWLLQAQVQIAF